MTFKQKLENFKYYYKWHTIIAVFVIFLAVIGIKSCVESKEPDINILYVSDKYVQNDAGEKFQKQLSQNNFITDVNKDGKEYFYFEPVIISYEGNDNQNFAVYQKLQVQMFAGQQSLMLVHQYVLEDYDGAFENIGDYAKEDDKTFTGNQKFVSGISVEGNKFLEDIGINTENLYIAMHVRTEKQIKKGELEDEYKQAYKILDFILENQ